MYFDGDLSQFINFNKIVEKDMKVKVIKMKKWNNNWKMKRSKVVFFF